MDDATDADLIQRYAKNGDRAALATLVRRHLDFVYACARREMGGDAAAADDVTQAVFLTLARKPAAVPPRRVAAWLFRVTRYAASNARRLGARRTKHERRAATERAEAVMGGSKGTGAFDCSPARKGRPHRRPPGVRRNDCDDHLDTLNTLLSRRNGYASYRP